MADPEHLDRLLKTGVPMWNKWRQKNPKLLPDLTRAVLSGENLSEANFSDANLRYADLREADLSGADLREADLSAAELSGAILSGAVLGGANFGGANLIGARLIGAHLPGAILHQTKLADADFTDACFALTAVISVDLSAVKGLETIDHWMPCPISIDTIYKSKGKIPEVFLRGCGVPENFITYMHSLVGEAVQFYSCFISYTEKDDAFSERLYNDLQAAGVRCWRWREDAKWGKSIWGSVDEAVRLYDKLVVVCSKHSLGGKAPAVIREIERALQKEDEHIRAGKPCEVLFPIMLDDFIFKKWQHHRKADVLAKNVGDFRGWSKDHAAYTKSLKRLIRDLEAEPSAAGKK